MLDCETCQLIFKSTASAAWYLSNGFRDLGTQLRTLPEGEGGIPTVGRGNQTVGGGGGGKLIFRGGEIFPPPLNELFAFRGVCSKVDVLIA